MTLGIGTLLIGLAVLVVVVVLVVMPLFEPKTPVSQLHSRPEALEAERRAVVRAIRDLDLDYRTQKLNEEDYKVLRMAQARRGAEILRELDALSREQPAGPSHSQQPRDIDAEIEQAVAALRSNTASAKLTCPACGKAIQAEDRFCARCGQALQPKT
ncbi:MAG: zinc-ribbon domain-containing protein [Anaerolineae bacterium]|nr:zinc-ribbon domain-containing protein [Thermoflexales bacterium]MDW8406775.1 zinc-ribbon domain-containing protein [Anaerolineae bacterium]